MAAKSAKSKKAKTKKKKAPARKPRKSPPTRGRRSSGRTDGTIHAVAERAQVSISTVSRFLNGKKKLAAETEKRILSAVAKLGYAPNRVAQSLRQGRTNSIGLILPDSSNPFFSGLVRGAEDTLREAGYSLVLFNSSEEAEREQEHMRTLQSLRCDGAMVIPAAMPMPDKQAEKNRWETMVNSKLPLVFVDRIPPVEHDLVVVDNESGGFEAGRYIADQGHKRVAVIGPDYTVSSSKGRFGGFRRAMRAAGVSVKKENEARVPPTVQDGFSAATQFLEQKDPPTAIFCTSNRLAIGTVAAIKARGLKCPKDVSVVGYDSYDWQDVFEPRLTTIRQPSDLLGKRGAELLLERLDQGRKGPPEKVVLRSELQIRESCKAPSK